MLRFRSCMMRRGLYAVGIVLLMIVAGGRVSAAMQLTTSEVIRRYPRHTWPWGGGIRIGNVIYQNARYLNAYGDLVYRGSRYCSGQGGLRRGGEYVWLIEEDANDIASTIRIWGVCADGQRGPWAGSLRSANNVALGNNQHNQVSASSIGNNRETSEANVPLEIVDFSASKMEGRPGERITLRWSVRGVPSGSGSFVVLGGSALSSRYVDATGQVEVTLPQDGTTAVYMLVARRGQERQERRLSIRVNRESTSDSEPLEIVDFSASKMEGRPGEKITLRWSVRGVPSGSGSFVVLGGSALSSRYVDATGQVEVTLPQDGTTAVYMLVARRGQERQERRLSIRVNRESTSDSEPLEIVDFSASKMEGRPGEKITLRWSVRGFSPGSNNFVTIIGDGLRRQYVGSTGEVEVTVPQNASSSVAYLLSAQRGEQWQEKRLFIRVIESPNPEPLEIVDFSASKAEVRPGEKITLRWSVRGFSPGSGNFVAIGGSGLSPRFVGSTGEVEVTVPQDASSSVVYLLSAQRGGQRQDKRLFIRVSQSSVPNP